MNWDQHTYGFGYPNAPPLTPTKTPTAATFPSPSPALQTPPNNSHNFELHSGWTPNFAEEYSVFNTSPHILDTHRPILDVQGQPISNQEHPLSASEETFPQNFQSQFQQTSPNPKLPLPPVELSRRLSSSPRPPVNQSSNLPPSQPSGAEKATQHTTPRKGKGKLEERGSAQTATPPHTASRGVRRLAAKPTLAPSSMSQTQGFGQGSMHQNGAPPLDFSSMDMYGGYPMSAPATAPGYLQGKSFWDHDTSMTGMDMSFGHEHHVAAEPSHHKHSNSLDWSRSNELFQNTANNASFDMGANQHPTISEAETGPKDISFSGMEGHHNVYETEHPSRKQNVFSSPARTGVVDPGLLFSFPVTRSDFPSIQTPSGHRQAEAVVRQPQPYQHQLRESKREQEEELRRSRPSSQASFHSRDGRAFASPTRASSRASLQRSSSTSSGMKLQSQRSMERSSRSQERRSSPLKRNRTSLSSIPEASRFKSDNKPTTRTDVTFTIDANGRARTEAVIVSTERQPLKRSASSGNSRDWDDSQPESSDEEIIIIPSRNTSFSLPEPERRDSGNNNILSRTRLERSYSKRGRGSSIYSQSSGGEQSYRNGPNRAYFDSSQDPESEAETVVEQPLDERGGRSGDAASALRKVLEDRKRLNLSSRRVMADITPTKPRRGGGRSSRFAGGGSVWDESNITTPSSHADGDVDTPSTDRSGVTMCVCGGSEDDGDMIQCESCFKWLHMRCIGITPRTVPHVYICTFCTYTPSARGRLRDGGRGAARNARDLASSPLTRKSYR